MKARFRVEVEQVNISNLLESINNRILRLGDSKTGDFFIQNENNCFLVRR
jgi:hypothetical protein